MQGRDRAGAGAAVALAGLLGAGATSAEAMTDNGGGGAPSKPAAGKPDKPYTLPSTTHTDASDGYAGMHDKPPAPPPRRPAAPSPTRTDASDGYAGMHDTPAAKPKPAAKPEPAPVVQPRPRPQPKRAAAPTNTDASDGYSGMGSKPAPDRRPAKKPAPAPVAAPPARTDASDGYAGMGGTPPPAPTPVPEPAAVPAPTAAPAPTPAPVQAAPPTRTDASDGYAGLAEAGRRADRQNRRSERVARRVAKTPMGKPLDEQLNDTYIKLGRPPGPPPPSAEEARAFKRAGIPPRLQNRDRCVSDLEREINNVPPARKTDINGEPIVDPRDLDHAEPQPEDPDLIDFAAGAFHETTGVNPPIGDEDSDSYTVGRGGSYAGGIVSLGFKVVRKGGTKAVKEIADDGGPDRVPDATIEEVDAAARRRAELARGNQTKPGKVVIRARRERSPGPYEPGRAERPAPTDSATLRRERERALRRGGRDAEKLRWTFETVSDSLEWMKKLTGDAKAVTEQAKPLPPSGAPPHAGPGG